MTVANTILSLSLRNSGVNGIGQTPLADDINDSFTILNAWINEMNMERAVRVNRVILPVFPNLTTDVPFWSVYEHVLLTVMSVRLRQVYSLPPVQLDVQLAASALQAFNAVNLERIAAPAIAANDLTGYGIIFLALRAAGRVKDDQGVSQTSQDVTDAASLMTEMLDEWRRMRTVRVIPGLIPVIGDLSISLVLDPGMRNAIVLNLAVRLRDAFGAEVPKSLLDRAAMALDLVQANNQQQIAPVHAGPPETVIQVLFLALRMAGRINDTQSVSDGSKDVADAFSQLVMMLAQWQRKRWLVWNEEDVSAVSTGADYYTIGPRGDFNVRRPDKIHAAKVILGPGQFGDGGAVLPEELPFPLGAQPIAPTPNLVNIPLAIIEAKEDWNTIAIPDLKSIPAAVFYDSAFPIGRVYFWPVPPAGAYEMRLTIKAALPWYETVYDDLGLPPEYTEAIVNNLAVKIALASGAQVNPLLLAEARASLNTIKLANSQIPLLSMPAALSGHRGGDVSSWSGRGLNQAWTVGGTSVLG